MRHPNHWRLIRSGAERGPLNMAIDEAILEFVGKDRVPATLRFYSWNPPCLSLGYSQSVNDIDLDKLKEFEWDIVRRPTGGKAILHTDELTYSVIAHAQNPFVEGSVLDAYSRIANCLVFGLSLLNVKASSDAIYPVKDLESKNPAVCFERPSNYEIAVDGKKLIGSAQSRRLGGVLQHGSLPLYGDLSRILNVMKSVDPANKKEAVSNLLSRATTLEALTKTRIAFDEAAEALVKGFLNAWGIVLKEEQLTTQENERAIELLESKYASTEWTFRI